MSTQSYFVGPEFIEYNGHRWIEESDYAKALEQARAEGYTAGYGAAMDDGWGEPEHIKAAVKAALKTERSTRLRDAEQYGYQQGRADAARDVAAAYKKAWDNTQDAPPSEVAVDAALGGTDE